MAQSIALSLGTLNRAFLNQAGMGGAVMAWLERKGTLFRIRFRFGGKATYRSHDGKRARDQGEQLLGLNGL